MRALAAEASALEWALKRDRRIVVGGLMAVIAVSWAYILAGAGIDTSDPSGARAMLVLAADWTPGYFLLMLTMWWAMMVAMMLPGAAPMILLFAAINRKNGERGHAEVRTGLFAAGYVVTWGVFGLLAATLQWGLDQLALLTPMMASASVPLGAALLIAAGIYQLTPLKHACLRHCRSPIHFLGHRWRRGAAGAVLMGLEHGLFCLGCCWVLMGLLFYGGVMSLVWIGGLALYVLLEKLAPAGHWIGRFGGTALILWGAVILVQYGVGA
jgi:predicted metal-binding membrane protein